MTTKAERRHTLDDVLAELAALPVPPDCKELRVWLNRYPDYKSPIIEFVTDWINMEASKVAHVVTADDVNLVVNRTMSRVQQLLEEAERPAAIRDLTAEIAAAGHDLGSFQQSVRIDHSMLTCLIGRMVRPATIPLRLVYDMAEALRRNVELVRDYLRQPPQLAAAYKARQRPEPKQQDFAYIVQHADLPEAAKARWLAEAPDPALRD